MSKCVNFECQKSYDYFHNLCQMLGILGELLTSSRDFGNMSLYSAGAKLRVGSCVGATIAFLVIGEDMIGKLRNSSS